MVNKWFLWRAGQALTAAAARSVPRIADQRFARPEQQHQQNTQHAHHRENRLVQDDLDDAVPEPRRMAFHPGPECLLAGLMDIVPELTEPGEPQGLVGDPARTVIDHENKPAGQQQQPYKSEKTADHASPYICRARRRRQPITGLTGKFNLISTLSAFSSGAFRPGAARKALTLQGAPLIRPAMAAGAILPPLF